jgi:hypothetical protein
MTRHVDLEVAKFLGDLPPAVVEPILACAGLSVSTPIAAALTGCSVIRIRSAVDRGTLRASGHSHRRIAVSDLAVWTGRDYTPANIAAAITRRGNHKPTEAVSGAPRP